ncbi:hypothetical protein DFJ74DRAFT_683012 [Hyaloraphidium curvatum]|nr:hypothetical protein DFJ74DRAFT_683012 [Hyaloraphidium curvatum]
MDIPPFRFLPSGPGPVDPPLTDDEALRYLARIGFPGDALPPPTMDTLRKLVFLHNTSVPWENAGVAHPSTADAERKAAPGLQPHVSYSHGDAYERIAALRKGGYCVVINGAFKRLLVKVGFQVTNYSGRVAFPHPADPKLLLLGAALTHRGLIVWNLPDPDGSETINWLVDVGLAGLTPLAPVPFGSSTMDELLMGKTGAELKEVFISRDTDEYRLGYRIRHGVPGYKEDAEDRPDLPTGLADSPYPLRKGFYLQSWAKNGCGHDVLRRLPFPGFGLRDRKLLPLHGPHLPLVLHCPRQRLPARRPHHIRPRRRPFLPIPGR